MPFPDRSPLRSVMRLVRLAAVVYLLVLVLFAALQRRMIYFPSRAAESALLAEAARIGAEPWREKGGALIGWIVRARSQPARCRVLVFHGNAGFALHRTYYADGFGAAMTADVHLFEYPGYGARAGLPSEAVLLDAGEKALRQLKREAPSPVILVGESIGCGVAAGVAARAPEQVAGIVFITPMSSLADVAAHHYPFLPVRLFLADRYPVAEWLRSYHGPMAVTLAEDDEVIPKHIGQRLYDSYAGPKRLWIKPGTHNTMLAGVGAAWWREVGEFVLHMP
jgi:pimeloyl-ACP methyl ester carboxylesterase